MIIKTLVVASRNHHNLLCCTSTYFIIIQFDNYQKFIVCYLLCFSFSNIVITSGCVGVNLIPLFSILITFFGAGAGVATDAVLPDAR